MTDRMNDEREMSDAEQRLIARLRAPVAIDADSFDARVMAAVIAERPFGRSAGRGRSRLVAAISVAGLALAATVAFIMIGGGLERTPHDQRAASVARATTSTVHFTLVASGASRVAVAGSFNGWNATATPLRRVGDNTWVADIPLDAGRYVYQFVVDGNRWIPDPHAPRDPGDDFGSSNSVVTVAASGSA